MSEKVRQSEQQTGIYYAPWERTADRILTPFEHFVHKQSTSSLFLMAATFIALAMANSVLAHFYHDITHIKLGFKIGSYTLEHSLHHWVNDGLMVLFFFVVGLELKREILVGELAHFRKAALPIIAAVGGMAVPALIFYLFNQEGDAAKGWAIPMATDIAFAIGILVLLGNRVPRSLMAFLVALAIADDLGAVIIIALFYTDTVAMIPLGFAGLFTGILFFFNMIGIRWAIPYFCVAVCLWLSMLFSGVHPTLAGVIGAFSVPARPKYDPLYFRDQGLDLLDKFHLSHSIDRSITTNVTMKSIVHSIEELVQSVMTPLQRLQHIWHFPVAFLVIPVFAFVNAGIPLNADSISIDRVFIGTALGLSCGKLLGIAGFSWIAIKLGWAQLPNNTKFRQVMGAAMLGGIGFTMSIFIAGLAYTDNDMMLQTAKAGILAASVVSGIAGYLWLLYSCKDIRYESSSMPVQQ